MGSRFCRTKNAVRLVLIVALAMLTGCSYLTDRGRDAMDVFTVYAGVGVGAKMSVGPLCSGLLVDFGAGGLRGGVLSAPGLSATHRFLDVNFLGSGVYKFPVDGPQEARGKSIYIPGHAGVLVGLYPFWDDRHSDASHYTQIEVVAGLGPSIRLGFNPGELADFLLGLATVDIYDDDLQGRRRADARWVQESFDTAEKVEVFFYYRGHRPKDRLANLVVTDPVRIDALREGISFRPKPKGSGFWRSSHAIRLTRRDTNSCVIVTGEGHASVSPLSRRWGPADTALVVDGPLDERLSRLREEYLATPDAKKASAMWRFLMSAEEVQIYSRESRVRDPAALPSAVLTNKTEIGQLLDQLALVPRDPPQPAGRQIWLVFRKGDKTMDLAVARDGVRVSGAAFDDLPGPSGRDTFTTVPYFLEWTDRRAERYRSLAVGWVRGTMVKADSVALTFAPFLKAPERAPDVTIDDPGWTADLMAGVELQLTEPETKSTYRGDAVLATFRAGENEATMWVWPGGVAVQRYTGGRMSISGDFGVSGKLYERLARIKKIRELP